MDSVDQREGSSENARLRSAYFPYLSLLIGTWSRVRESDMNWPNHWNNDCSTHLSNLS